MVLSLVACSSDKDGSTGNNSQHDTTILEGAVKPVGFDGESFTFVTANKETLNVSENGLHLTVRKRYDFVKNTFRILHCCKIILKNYFKK